MYSTNDGGKGITGVDKAYVTIRLYLINRCIAISTPKMRVKGSLFDGKKIAKQDGMKLEYLPKF
jgi:hypothetical protein